jgi:hypothetical protein
MRLLPWGETNFCISHEEKKLIHVSYQLPAGKNALIKGVWIGLSRKKPACLSFTSPCEFFSYFVFVGLLERDEEDGFQGNGGLEREQDFFQCILGDRRQAGWFNFKFFFFLEPCGRFLALDLCKSHQPAPLQIRIPLPQALQKNCVIDRDRCV